MKLTVCVLSRSVNTDRAPTMCQALETEAATPICRYLSKLNSAYILKGGGSQ